MHAFFLGLNAITMIILPLLLGRWVAGAFWRRRRQRLDWGLFGVGAITFVLSQVGHLPFNWLVLNRWQWFSQTEGTGLFGLALFLGLSAGIFEEGSRALTYRFWATSARDWGSGLMLGLGHGGIESMLLGLSAAINGYILLAVRQGRLLEIIPSVQQRLLASRAEEVFALNPAILMLGSLERLFALCLHLALSLLVLQSFLRRQWRWLGLAIGWHALADGLAVALALRGHSYLAEGVIGLLALASLGLIWRLRPPAPEAETALQPVPGLPLPAEPAKFNAERLEESRYQ